MARKNIFQLVEESYDIQSEIRKIRMLLYTEKYFQKGAFLEGISLKTLIDDYLFSNWKYRGSCITIDEYFNRANANIPKEAKKVSEDQIVNFLEVMENFIKLYFDNDDELCEKHKIKYYTEFESVFCDLINTLEKKMGLTVREYKDKVILYPKNAPLEKVIDLVDDEDVQWELIRYVRENLSLAEKRKSLAYLATNLHIEQDSKEKNEHIRELLKTSCNLLNNLHIRHNNKTGDKTALQGLKENEAIALCDMLYNEMLTIVLLREHKEYEEVYENFHTRQKEISGKMREDK